MEVGIQVKAEVKVEVEVEVEVDVEVGEVGTYGYTGIEYRDMKVQRYRAYRGLEACGQRQGWGKGKGKGSGESSGKGSGRGRGTGPLPTLKPSSSVNQGFDLSVLIVRVSLAVAVESLYFPMPVICPALPASYQGNYLHQQQLVARSPVTPPQCTPETALEWPHQHHTLQPSATPGP